MNLKNIIKLTFLIIKLVGKWTVLYIIQYSTIKLNITQSIIKPKEKFYMYIEIVKLLCCFNSWGLNITGLTVMPLETKIITFYEGQ